MKIKLLNNPSLLSVGSALSLQGFTLLTFMLLARLLPVEQMGAWALWLTFVAIADMTRQGLLQNGLVRFSAHEPEGWAGWLTAAFALNSLASVGLGLLLALCSWLAGFYLQMPSLQTLAALALPFTLLQGLGRFAEAVQVTKRDFRGVLFANSLSGAAQMALTGYCFLQKTTPSLLQLLGFQTIGLVLGLLLVAIFFRGHFAFGKFEVEKMWELYRFGRYVAGTNFFSMLFQRLDTLLIGVFLTPASVALYNVATRLNGLLDLPLNSLSLAQFPSMAKSLADGKPTPEVFNGTVRKLLFVQGPLSILLIIFAPQAVQVLGGGNYADASVLLQILALAGLVKPWGRTFGMTLDAMGKSSINFKMLLFSMAVNLVLMLTLLPAFGVTGAAVAAGLGILLTVGAGQLLLKRNFKLELEATIMPQA
ncbi:MAG: oligosaccharide flippase family protein [Bacteroidetes bacterium]|nr:oligosaccharide flippase family protein [Bacteroidota bacterium]